MSILLMDDFRGYPTASEMLADGGKGGPWTTFDKVADPNFSLVSNPTWRGDASTLRALNNNWGSDRRAPQRDFSASAAKVVCAQFICGTTGGSETYTESCNFTLFQEPVTDKDLANSNQLSSFYGVSIRATSTLVGATGQVGVYYTILTGTNGVSNQALIGYLRPWTRDRHYHVELKVDHTNPTARITVYVNGALEMDATYDRDRVDSGLQTKDFKRVLLGGAAYTSTQTRYPKYSNLVIYTDEPGTVFPMGPIDLVTVNPTAGQGYDGLRSVPNADDTTYATVIPGATMNGTFEDLTAGNPVLAVDATIRHGSVAGLEPSQITTRIRKADSSVVGTVTTTAAPGVPPTHRRIRLPADMTLADVNGATFQIQAAG